MKHSIKRYYTYNYLIIILLNIIVKTKDLHNFLKILSPISKLRELQIVQIYTKNLTKL